MHLRSLQIQGFKSFPDPIRLEFGEDITAIVGPNGSGKSNISDAIRWVMGEQSTKTLRGAKMEDVIFGGTQKRPQLGFAEASLVFDNSDRYFPVNADEMTVTRRYYRSGENEFYLNKQSVRLKDVNELFMDTGLGREGYSNISQGRIDEILSVKSTDRREIFEEAAGISKYRHRKEETERRLLRTEENLLRINDKISELELQVEPLREQSEKAQQYLTLQGELKGLEIAVSLQSLNRLAATARKAEADYSSAKFILEQEHEAIEQHYKKTEQLSQALREQDIALEERRAVIDAEEASRQQLAALRASLDTERRGIEETLRRLLLEQDDQAGRSGSLRSQIAERQARIEQIDLESAGLGGQIEVLREQLRALTESTEGKNRSYFDLRDQHGACGAELAGKKADLAALDQGLQELAGRIEELSADHDSAAVRLAETAEQLEACRGRLTQAREEAKRIGNTVAGHRLLQGTRNEKAASLEAEVRARTVELDTVTAKLNLLREMEKDYEGFSKAVRFVMQQAKAGALRSIHGPISMLIKTEDRFSVAVETALGASMQSIVVSTEEDGKHAIRMLKTRDMGRATFLPITAVESRGLSESGLADCPGYLGVASALVDCDPKYRAIVENLLGRTVFTETLDDAVAMAKRYHSRFRIVTLDGQVMNPGGSMTGGSVSQKAGVLSRSNEIARLEAARTKLQARCGELNKQLTEANRQRDLAAFELNTALEELREQEDLILRLEGEEKQYTVLQEAVSAADAGNTRELQAARQRLQAETARKAVLTADCEALTAKLASLQTRLDAVSLDQTKLTRSGEDLTDRLTALRMELAGLAAEKQTASEAIRHLEGLAAELETDSSQKQALIEDQRRLLTEAEVRIRENEAEGQRQSEKVEGLRQALRDLLEARTAAEAERTATDHTVQQKNKDIIEMEREAARLEAKQNAARMEERQILDKLWESYELTPSTAPAHAAEIESVTAANRRIAELRKKIHALGTPNLGAIEEYARVSERYTYLTGQRDDVENSKKELERIIRDITRNMTAIFTEEFAKINHYFGETFMEMFHGGKASLELEDPNEPLSCGIEIKVQPPGKQLKTITLLSGGEKAFVAIALYFSILKVRPTPFCMLDEIDAALDDRNVERFAEYLRSLCRKTQFIVITHRRGTMEQADALFGVTMQEQGVSKILHLDLDKLEQELGITQ